MAGGSDAQSDGRACFDGYDVNEKGKRAAAREQPEVIERPNVQDSKLRFYCRVLLAAKQTGKACAWEKRVSECRGATREEVIEARQKVIADFLSGPRDRAPPQKRHRQPVEGGDEQPPHQARPRRIGAPSSAKSLMEPKEPCAPLNPRAGPGRGRSYESSKPLLQQIREALVLPPEDAESKGNWFERLKLKEKWKSERMAQLEQQVEHLLAENEKQAMTIEALRARVAELEQLHETVARDVLSYIRSEPVLRESNYCQKLEDEPEWALLLGIGYNDVQKRNLIYVHLNKLLEELRRVTRGDAMKAKQLSDLLHLRGGVGDSAGRQERKIRKCWRGSPVN